MSTLTAAGIPIEAWHVLCAREYAGFSQAVMAEHLTQATGTLWSPAMVRHMERGKKSVTVPIAKAVCDVTGYPWSWFTAAPADGPLTQQYDLGTNPADLAMLLTCDDAPALAMAS